MVVGLVAGGSDLVIVLVKLAGGLVLELVRELMEMVLDGIEFGVSVCSELYVEGLKVGLVEYQKIQRHSLRSTICEIS